VGQVYAGLFAGIACCFLGRTAARRWSCRISRFCPIGARCKQNGCGSSFCGRAGYSDRCDWSPHWHWWSPGPDEHPTDSAAAPRYDSVIAVPTTICCVHSSATSCRERCRPPTSPCAGLRRGPPPQFGQERNGGVKQFEVFGRYEKGLPCGRPCDLPVLGALDSEAGTSYYRGGEPRPMVM